MIILSSVYMMTATPAKHYMYLLICEHTANVQFKFKSSAWRQRGLTGHCFKYIDRPICLQIDEMHFGITQMGGCSTRRICALWYIKQVAYLCFKGTLTGSLTGALIENFNGNFDGKFNANLDGR